MELLMMYNSARLMLRSWIAGMLEVVSMGLGQFFFFVAWLRLPDQ